LVALHSNSVAVDERPINQRNRPSPSRYEPDGRENEAHAVPCPFGSDLIVHLWDLLTLESLATFPLEDFGIVCALTADGDTAIVGDRRSLHLLFHGHRDPEVDHRF
jgi:hypothetical protein